MGRRPKSPGDYQQGLLTFQPKSKVSPALNLYGRFLKWWYTQIIYFNKVFHYKPSILGYLYFWKHPYINYTNCCISAELPCPNHQFLGIIKFLGCLCGAGEPQYVFQTPNFFCYKNNTQFSSLPAPSLVGGFNHLKNMSQNGNLPQIGLKIKNIWNHHLESYILSRKKTAWVVPSSVANLPMIHPVSGFPSFMSPPFFTSQKQVEV